MLKLFSSKPDSPLADDKGRKETLADIARMQPANAVREIGDWLDALQGEFEFTPELRFQILCEFDVAAAPPIRALTREYFTAGNLPRQRAREYWQWLHQVWRILSEGYAHCLDLAQHDAKGKDLAKRNLPLLCVRLLRAHGQWLKWGQFMHGPLDPTLWQNAGAAFLAAVEGRFAALAQRGFGAQEQLSVQGEYTRLLALQASSIDRLRPLQIEVAERIISYVADKLSLSERTESGASWWIDPARPMPPVRLVRPPKPSSSLYYLDVAEARAAIANLISALERDILPPELDLGAQYAPKVVLPVLRHFARYWSSTPPTRAHARHAIRSSLRTVSGLDAVKHRVLGRVGTATESSIEDVSRGGFSVRARAADEEQLRLGALIALQPDGGDNWLVGVVRRVARQVDGSLQLGIETLSHKPAAVDANNGGELAQALLLDPLEIGALVRLILPQYSYEDGVGVSLEQGPLIAELQPAGLVESGEDYDLASYRVVGLAAA